MGRVKQQTATALPAELVHEINDCGFFPQLVCDSVDLALGSEQVDTFLVHHEATFAHDGVGRHLSVLVLTPTRLLICHTDEDHERPGEVVAVSSTESVPLRSLGAVALSRVVSHPECFGSAGAEVVETWLTLSWDAMRKLDLVPANCADPNCEADHGFTGTNFAEDMVIRMSPAADGIRNVDQLVAFGTILQQRVGR